MIGKTVKVYPGSPSGTINVPSSKSIGHRAIICAALSHGKSVIEELSLNDDINATLQAVQAFGAKVQRKENKIIIHGVKHIAAPKSPIDCKESGSTLRFLIPILASTGKTVVFKGAPSLIKRPMNVYQSIAKQDDIQMDITTDKILVNGVFKGFEYHVDATVSSQFITGLMFALPLLKHDSKILLNEPLESKNYVNITIDILQKFGIEIHEFSTGYFIPGNQTYKPTTIEIEGDYSQAAFFLTAGILNGHVKINNLPLDSRQGDRYIIEFINQMKGRLIINEKGYTAIKSNTFGATLDITNTPDLGPILALLGCVSDGTTIIKGAKRLRYKESDRILSTVGTLKRLGANISVKDDDIYITKVSSLTGGVVDSYNDHRIAMMAAISATISNSPVIITQADAITKSYPNFYKDLMSLGLKIEVQEL